MRKLVKASFEKERKKRNEKEKERLDLTRRIRDVPYSRHQSFLKVKNDL